MYVFQLFGSIQIEAVLAAPQDERTALGNWIIARMAKVPEERWEAFQEAAQNLMRQFTRPVMAPPPTPPMHTQAAHPMQLPPAPQRMPGIQPMQQWPMQQWPMQQWPMQQWPQPQASSQPLPQQSETSTNPQQSQPPAQGQQTWAQWQPTEQFVPSTFVQPSSPHSTPSPQVQQVF